MDRVEQLAQAYSQTPWRKQVQFLGLFSAALVCVAIVAGIYLSVTARSAANGRAVQEMQTQIQELEKNNADLQAHLAGLTSAREMEKRAESLGFEPVKTEETLFLVVPGYRERSPAELAPGAVPSVVAAPVMPDEYTESLFTWLQRSAQGAWKELPLIALFGGQP